MIWLPTFEQTQRMHDMIMEATGGGITSMRDPGLVHGSIAFAESGFGDVERFPTVNAKASAVCFSLIKNHAFIDGNKRIGVGILLLILKANQIKLQYTQDDLVDLGIGVANSRYNREDIEAWIEKHQMNA